MDRNEEISMLRAGIIEAEAVLAAPAARPLDRATADLALYYGRRRLERLTAPPVPFKTLQQLIQQQSAPDPGRWIGGAL